jgi:endonuclease V-like protein UPF0215 family
MNSPLSHVIGFDDAPFEKQHRGDVLLIGAVFSGTRLEGVLSGKVRRDGANATGKIIQLISSSRFATHCQAILLQGIAVAGFNVIDIHRLHKKLNVPVLVISRQAPDMDAIRDALLTKVSGGARKWALVQKAGPMQQLAGVYVQLAGIEPADAEALIQSLAINSNIPEPLRTAHLIAGGVTDGESRHRV